MKVCVLLDYQNASNTWLNYRLMLRQETCNWHRYLEMIACRHKETLHHKRTLNF